MWSTVRGSGSSTRLPTRIGTGIRSYACQKLEKQLSLRARPRPLAMMEHARLKFWNSGRMPVHVHGDKLGPVFLSVPFKQFMKMANQPHIQRMLMRLDLEDEDGKLTGESLQVLPETLFEKQPLPNDDYDYIKMRRWPREPPLKMLVPIWVKNEDKCPKVKAGGYTHEMFSRGLPCLVSDPENIPMYLEGDMSKAVDGDLRIADIELPPGVVPVVDQHHHQNQGPNLPDRAYPNYLVVRSLRIRG